MLLREVTILNFLGCCRITYEIRLATANRSRISIRGRPCKIFSHVVWSTCKIWLQFLILCAHLVPKMLRTLGPLGMGTWFLLGNTHYAIFGRFGSNGMDVSVLNVSKIGEAGVPPLWDGVVANPCKYAPPHICYHIKFGRCRENHLDVGRC